MKRKEFLKRLGVGTLSIPAFISACNSDDAADIKTETTDESSNTTVGDCDLTNSETEGPFPIKDPSSLVRQDITGDRTGVALDIEITILNKNNDCAALANAYVDIWQCDKDGYYSEYGGIMLQTVDFTAVHFLRGRQVTDSDGKVYFTSIFPGWYQRRSTHIHVHVYDSSGNSLLITQIAFPEEGDDSPVLLVNTASDYGYTKGMSGYTYHANDNVFRDGVDNELAAVEGSVDDGYSLTHSIVVEA